MGVGDSCLHWEFAYYTVERVRIESLFAYISSDPHGVGYKAFISLFRKHCGENVGQRLGTWFESEPHFCVIIHNVFDPL